MPRRPRETAREFGAGVRQIPLDLPFEERRGVEDFFVSASNEAAHAAIESWPKGWLDPVLVLVGPEGAGKSHLASIWADRAHAWRRRPGAVAVADVPHLVSNGALLIDDADREPLDEAAMFHLINAMRERNGSLLITAQTEPAAWTIATPDLRSRLRRAPLARIGAPDDSLLRALLVKLFTDRQLRVDTRVVDMIVARAERSFAAARSVVEALDQAALAAGRPVTRVLVQDVLARMFEPEGGES
ncbi:MAG: hypothetical protein BGP06_06030 [Rhizobiales bacterium 65-9]|nr:MAG: hypothetical protein BGP06_06030 [Rhizobiales bacterium 65-9]